MTTPCKAGTMDNFYENLAPEDIQVLDSLSRLLIELRESRSALLDHFGAADDEGLLERIRNGEVEEHPAYEAYLGARIISSTREAVRRELRDYMLEG